MADLPLEGRAKTETKEVPLTAEQRLERLEKDVVELARGVNTQGALLESIVHAFDSVIKTYLTLINRPTGVAEKPTDVK